MMRRIGAILAALFIISQATAADLCKTNTFTKAQAARGRWAYDSSCGLCHLYNLRGRVPGHSDDELPDIATLNEVYLKGLDGNGGMTPSLINDAFFGKWKDKQAFVDRIANATGAFPPKNYVRDVTELEVAAYILYERCGRM